MQLNPGRPDRVNVTIESTHDDAFLFEHLPSHRLQRDKVYPVEVEVSRTALAAISYRLLTKKGSHYGEYGRQIFDYFENEADPTVKEPPATGFPHEPTSPEEWQIAFGLADRPRSPGEV